MYVYILQSGGGIYYYILQKPCTIYITEVVVCTTIYWCCIAISAYRSMYFVASFCFLFLKLISQNLLPSHHTHSSQQLNTFLLLLYIQSTCIQQYTCIHAYTAAAVCIHIISHDRHDRDQRSITAIIIAHDRWLTCSFFTKWYRLLHLYARGSEGIFIFFLLLGDCFARHCPLEVVVIHSAAAAAVHCTGIVSYRIVWEEGAVSGWRDQTTDYFIMSCWKRNRIVLLILCWLFGYWVRLSWVHGGETNKTNQIKWLEIPWEPLPALKNAASCCT